MGMLDAFIKLNSTEKDKKVYIRPESIAGLSYHGDRGITVLTCVVNQETYQTEVKETPGVIFDMCDKSMKKFNPCTKQ